MTSLLVHHETYVTKQPYMDSNYVGKKWGDEVLNDHDSRCMNSFKISKNTFYCLLHDLQIITT